MQFMERYRSALRHERGWEVELTCPDCHHTGLPRIKGWRPNSVLFFPRGPTVFIRVHCAECGRDLRSVAGETLVAMFSDIEVSGMNKRLIAWFVIIVLFITIVPLVVQFVLKPGFHIASFGAILAGPLVLAFNYRIASLRRRCPCGEPKYIFMGLLGRTYCYRCSTCGNLLRVRD